MNATHKIILPAQIDADLDWTDVKESATAAVAASKKIFWQFDFGLQHGSVPFTDSAAFYSFAIAIEHFVKTILPSYLSSTIGVGLYEGPLLCHMEDDKDLFYIADVFAEYFHRLASFLSDLPDGISPFCIFEVASIENPALLAMLFSKERFTYVDVVLENAKDFKNSLTSQFGICLPNQELFTAEVEKKLNLLMKQQEGRSTRFIPEVFLNEQWDGLDELFVIREGVSSVGMRRLRGFEASGGVITFV